MKIINRSARALALLVSMSGIAAEPVATRLTTVNGAAWPVVVAPDAPEAVRNAAADLARQLERIAGVPFAVREGDGTEGLAVGTSRDFPAIDAGVAFDPENPLRREEYRLYTHEQGVWLIGATELAVQHAVWDFLYRLGYRQFFPGSTWEVVPSLPSPVIAVDTLEKPAYHARRIWHGHGTLASRREGHRQWSERNRVAQGFRLHSGHAYDGIIRANPDAFREHPEFYALVNGERRLAGQVDGSGNIKFCISNPDLRRLVVAHAERTLRADPTRDSLSMDPSDGGNWCECAPCAAMGSISDRVLILANQVADAINRLGFGDKYVGIYAYGFHGPPPAIDVHPNVIVSATAGFLRGGYTLDDIIRGWQARGAVMGIYDYFSVMPWDWDLPGRPRASSPAYMADSLPRFHGMGIRFHDAESSDNWGPCGLGYYVAARMLWDIREADRVAELVEDFLTRAFGPAAEPMREFYRLIDRDNRPLLTGNLVGQMVRALDAAWLLAVDREVIRRRLLDLVLYTRYVDLYASYQRADNTPVTRRLRIAADAPAALRDIGAVLPAAAAAPAATAADALADELLDLFEPDTPVPEPEPVYLEVQSTHRREAFEALLRHAYRIRDTGMIHFQALWARQNTHTGASRERSLESWLEEAESGLEECMADYSAEEILAMLGTGIAENAVLAFETVQYSDDLVPATPLNLPPVDPGTLGSLYQRHGYQGGFELVTWLDIPGELTLKVTGGLIPHYRDRGHVQLRLLSPREITLEPVAHDDSVPPDGEERTLRLGSPYDGYHRLELRDGGDASRIVWDDGWPMTLPCSPEVRRPPVRGIWTLYFYVPKGAKTVAGYMSHGAGRLVDGAGNETLDFAAIHTPGYFSVPVPEGRDGQLWRVDQAQGHLMLMTVPPYLARSEKELLLPREVVEADRKPHTGKIGIMP